MNESLSRVEGGILFVGLLLYTWWLLKDARQAGSAKVTAEYDQAVDALDDGLVAQPLYFQVGFVVAGLGLLILGSRFLVASATTVAEAFNVSDLVIGLTVVAAGTSLPELATSVMAAHRGQREIAVGNVVGSNLYNLLGVLGLSAALTPSGISVNRELIRLDFPDLLAATLVLVPTCWNGFTIERWEGMLLAAFYIAYVVYLVMEAGDSTAPELFRTMMLIVIPIVTLAFTATGIQGWRKYRTAHSA